MANQQHTVEFTAKCWIYNGKGSWHFVTLPPQYAAEISYFSKAMNGGKRIGWGSVRVTAQIGKTSWDTSLFPDSKNHSYVLPLKLAVRKAENIVEDLPLKVRVSIPIP